MSESEKKIFVDDDWKRQAHEEKRRLAEQEEKALPKKESKRTSGAQAERLPPASIEVLITSFATQALLAMGVREHPTAGRMLDLELAKFNIDRLAVLDEKTKGNLTKEEKALLDQTLHQLRMAFVEVAAANSGPIG